LSIIKYTGGLERSGKYIVARQLLRSGTSIGANIREAQNAESKSDFIHKMKIAVKEVDETVYGLTLCSLSEGFPECGTLIAVCEDLVRSLFKIIGPSKRSQ
jgi:four helix bundle protein